MPLPLLKILRTLLRIGDSYNHPFMLFSGPQREKFPGGTKVDTGLPILIGAIQALSGSMPSNHFFPDRCRSSFKSEGITIFAYGLGPMKNTTRHKIGFNPARGSGGAL